MKALDQVWASRWAGRPRPRGLSRGHGGREARAGGRGVGGSVGVGNCMLAINEGAGMVTPEATLCSTVTVIEGYVGHAHAGSDRLVPGWGPTTDIPPAKFTHSPPFATHPDHRLSLVERERSPDGLRLGYMVTYYIGST